MTYPGNTELSSLKKPCNSFNAINNKKRKGEGHVGTFLRFASKMND